MPRPIATPPARGLFARDRSPIRSDMASLPSSLRLHALVVILMIALSAAAFSATPDIVPGTARLTWPEEDLSERMMNGAHAFIERQIDESTEKRKRHWNYDLSSPEAYVKSIEPNRERFRKMIGVVDERIVPGLEFYGDEKNSALVAETREFEVLQARWRVFRELSCEGLFMRPKGEVRGGVVLLPDADQLPEEYAGLGDGRVKSHTARFLAEHGYEVVIPVLTSRGSFTAAKEDKRLARSDQTYREWIYRQAFHMGRHVIGYETQVALAAVDWLNFRHHGKLPIRVLGYGEGGMAALCAAAVDERIDGAFVSGRFGTEQTAWSEPIYRNLHGRLREFGDREIASLIQPRPLFVAVGNEPVVTGHKGESRKANPESVAAILDGLPRIAGRRASAEFVHLTGEQAKEPLPWEHVSKLFEADGRKLRSTHSKEALKEHREGSDWVMRESNLFDGMERHVQGLVRKSEHVRDAFFLHQVQPDFAGGKWSTNKEHPVRDPAGFIEKAKAFRKKFHEEAMGKFDETTLPPNARTRKIAETDKWTAYDVVLDVYPELFAWGALVLPKDLKPGERRPVVVCQHGRNGVPLDTINKGTTAYNDFAARLAERGFITFAPHNLYRGEDRYRWLDRKANAVGCTLFSFIIAQHDQILKWLKTQPFIDGGRMAFYGLSYGGETAVRVPPILEDYCLSICSGDFNQWTRKIAAVDQPFSFMRTIEWEMPYWNLGHTFDYAEMAYLIFPRPFMVERGHHDRVGRDRWVAHEYAKVRWLYAQYGLGDRTEIEYFQGGHSINGMGTFDFLHRHLNWPKPE